MFSPKRIIILCILLLVLLPYGIVLAKGSPDKITIVGFNLPKSLEITDPVILKPFAMDKFINFSISMEEPKGLETGYKITRYYQIYGIGLKDIDRFIYYPKPGGDGGYVFYEGIIDKMFIYGGSPQDGKWFQATEEGDRAIRQILTDYGLRSVKDSLRVSFPKEHTFWLGYVGLATVVSVVLFISYRRHSSRRMVA